MKRILLFIAILFASVNFSSAQRVAYSDYFSSSSDIRKYFDSNLSSLNPIEGEYECEFNYDYITPFVHQTHHPITYTIWIVRNSNGGFTVYANNDKFHKSSYLRLEQIGNSNAYRFYYSSSSARVYLENGLHFVAQLHLDHKSAITFTGNGMLAGSVNIYPVYDCIKVYPN